MLKSAGDGESKSLQEMLWYYYTVYYPINSSAIDDNFAEMEPILKPMTQKRKRRMIRLATDLCVEHERAAFIEGMKVGGRLGMELKDEDKTGQIANCDE